MSWYINPDNGGQARLAARCSAASHGRYNLRVFALPKDATQQREQLVRRLAARDASIDLMSLDLPFVPEFAEAGFLRPFTTAEAASFIEGVLKEPVKSATWKGTLVAAPFGATSQLLWYRKSVARQDGLDLTRGIVTWEEIIRSAERTGTTVEVQGNRYEGYLVWINALVASAGGAILANPSAGRAATPGLVSPAGTKAASIIRRLASSHAADPALSTSDEETTRAAFQGRRGGFMVNWPYVYGAAQEAVAGHALDEAVLADIGWARYPRAEADRESRPPLGGIDIAIGRFSRHELLAVEAARCISSERNQIEYMLDSKNPVARSAAYDDPRVRLAFPMAELIRESIAASAPRPATPYYSDVSTAIVRIFHPEQDVEPEVTPARAARLIVEVLHDCALL